jgi:hypothetical protein
MFRQQCQELLKVLCFYRMEAWEGQGTVKGGLTSTRGTGQRRRIPVLAGGFPSSGDFLEIHPIRPDRVPLANERHDRCLIGAEKKFNSPAKLRCLVDLDVPDKIRTVVNRISSLYGRPVGNLLEILSEKPLYLNTKKAGTGCGLPASNMPGRAASSPAKAMSPAKPTLSIPPNPKPPHSPAPDACWSSCCQIRGNAPPHGIPAGGP